MPEDLMRKYPESSTNKSLPRPPHVLMNCHQILLTLMLSAGKLKPPCWARWLAIIISIAMILNSSSDEFLAAELRDVSVMTACSFVQGCANANIQPAFWQINIARVIMLNHYH